MTNQLEQNPDKDLTLWNHGEVCQLLGELGMLQHMGLGPNGLPTKTMIAICLSGSKTHSVVGFSVCAPQSRQPTLQAVALSKRLHEPCEAAIIAAEMLKEIGPVTITKVPAIPLAKN